MKTTQNIVPVSVFESLLKPLLLVKINKDTTNYLIRLYTNLVDEVKVVSVFIQ